MRGPRPNAEELVARLARVVAGTHDGIAQGISGVDAPRGPVIQLGAPALVRSVVDPAEVAVHEVELTVEALAVSVLVVRQPQRRLRRRAEHGGDAEALVWAALAALRDDDDRAVRRARAVQCRGVRAFQHGDRLDVVRVDVRRRVADVVAAQRAAPVAIVARRRVVDRNAVHDDQRLILAEDRAGAARDDARRAEWVTGIGDIETGHVAL